MRAIRHIAIALLLAAVLSACGGGEGGQRETAGTASPARPSARPSVSGAEVATPTPAPTPEPVRDEVWQALQIAAGVPEDGVQAFHQYLDGIEVSYEFFGLVPLEEALAKYDALPAYETDSAVLIQNGKLDADGLRALVERNTEEYLAGYTGSKFSQLPEELFDAAFPSVVEGVEDALSRGADPHSLDEKLLELKLVATTERGIGMMLSDGGVMAVNVPAYEAAADNWPELDYLRTLILHETNHLVQNHTAAEKAQTGFLRRNGVCREWEDLELDPLFWSWYFEGTAELLMMDRYGLEEPTVYLPYVSALQGFSLALLLREDAGPATIAEIMLQPDLDGLFDLFSCGSGEDRMEIVSMMYALEIALAQPSDFFQAHKSAAGGLMEDRSGYLYGCGASAGQTLTKAFYRGLSGKAADGWSVQQLFTMISLFETEMKRLVGFTRDPDSTQGFVVTYQAVQGAFFEMLSESTAMTAGELAEAFKGYHHSLHPADILELPLSAEEISFLYNLHVTRDAGQRIAIRTLQ